MMEGPQEVLADENRALQEKKYKRTFKTPHQVTALENFYNEHKYPTEAMKLKLAESIGLTEKQVSGWFCHRRLKDKKPPSDGKQDRSSGVIQDHDSCGSTKQAENKHYDLKEVESKRLTSQGILAMDVRFDQHNMDDDEDTSSGSSSPLKDNFHPLNAKYPTNDLKNVTGPSGYLKVKGQVENAAITAVKRQMGRNFREDGPPLGIDFEPLPPGAFQNPVTIPVNQSYYVGDHTVLDGSKTFHLPNASKMYERYNPVGLDESAGLEIRHHSNSQYRSAPPFSKHSRHSVSGRSLQMVAVNDDSDGETDHNFETKVKHGPNSHLFAYGKNTQGNPAEYYQHSYNSGPPKVHYKDRIEPETSDFTYNPAAFPLPEDKVLSRKTHKGDEYYREGRAIDEYSKSKLVSAKIHPQNGMRVTKRRRDEFLYQVSPRKEAFVEFSPITNQTKRSTARMTSSFNDDETAESTSSGN